MHQIHKESLYKTSHGFHNVGWAHCKSAHLYALCMCVWGGGQKLAGVCIHSYEILSKTNIHVYDFLNIKSNYSVAKLCSSFHNFRFRKMSCQHVLHMLEIKCDFTNKRPKSSIAMIYFMFGKTFRKIRVRKQE